MKNLYIVLFTLLTFTVSAQKAEKVMEKDVFSGIDARAQGDIDGNLNKAREQFLKIISKEKENAMAHFGLAVVYSYDKYSKKDYFEAWEYFQVADKNQAQFTPDQLTILNQYFPKVDLKRRNRPIKKNMQWYREVVEDELIKFVREENNLEYANRFLKDFPDSRYHANVVHIRNYIEYRSAENANSVEALNTFLKKYPEAAQKNVAAQKRNAIAYKNAVAKNSLSILKAFVAQYPDAEQIEDAKKLMGELAYAEAAKTRSLEIIEQFMREYPNSSKMPEAKVLKRQLLFEWAKSVNTIDAYNKFVALYPEGEMYIDIFNLKASAMGQQLLMDFPMENYKFIKGYDNKNMNDFGGDIIVKTNGEILLIANTKIDKNSMQDAWFLSLDANGKMLSNNILGNTFDDQVNKAVMTANNDVYVAGITNAIVDSVAGQAWLFKMNAAKNIYNNKLEGQEVKGLAVYPDGKALLCGDMASADSLVPFLIRVNENGRKLWSRSYSQTGAIHGVAISDNKTAFVAGHSWYFAIDESGYLKWDKIVDPSINITAVNVAKNGNVIFAGLKGMEGYVLACDALGTMLWESTFDAKKLPIVESVTALNDNGVLLAGTSADDKVIIVKVDASGAVSTARAFSLPGGIYLNGIAPAEGSFAVVSATRLSPKQDILVFKLNF